MTKPSSLDVSDRTGRKRSQLRKRELDRVRMKALALASGFTDEETQLAVKIKAHKLAAEKLHVLLDKTIKDWFNLGVEGDDWLTNPETRSFYIAAGTLDLAIENVAKISLEDRIAIIEQQLRR